MIRPAEGADPARLSALLEGAGLPTADLVSAAGLSFWVAESEGSLVGVVGMERFGEWALLRSLAVAPDHRRRRLGHQLVAHLEASAREAGVTALVLLTETAETFFRALGYEVMERGRVPEAVKASAEFRSLCPASAVCMSKSLTKVFNVLFLCTGNSARSILAEAILNHRGKGRFKAFSAGSYPKGAVHPLALATLERRGLPTKGLRSKPWDEFAQPGAPALDFVFTVCDNAAGEACPVWPGRPITAHWGQSDPAAVVGSELEKTDAFRDAFRMLERRIELFTALPVATLEKVREIGKAP